MERPIDLTNIIALSITREKVEQLDYSQNTFQKLEGRLFLGLGAITSFTVFRKNEKLFVPFENDHISRLNESVQFLFSPEGFSDLSQKIKQSLHLALGLFDRQKIDFENFAFTVLLNFLPEKNEFIFVMRKRKLEPEKPLMLLPMGEERWIKAPSLMKIGQYSQEYKTLSNLKKIHPESTVEVYYCSKVKNNFVLDEGSTNNIFIFDGKLFKTPPLRSGVLKGIAREKIIQYFKKNGVICLETEIDESELESAQSIWLSNCVRGFRKVAQFKDKKFVELDSKYLKLWQEILKN